MAHLPTGRSIRSEWTLCEGVAHLNHGSFGATLRCVQREQQRLRDRMEANPTRFFLRDVPPGIVAVRHRLAEFVGAQAEDLALVENATAGANAVLRSLPLQPGDEIVCTSHVYGAVGRTIDAVCARSGAVRVQVEIGFPVVDPGELAPRVAAALTDRTRMIVVDHVTSATALVLPVADVVAVARDAGVPILVDGAHAPGMVPLDLDALDADFYVGNLHKWVCSAKGCALLWARPGGRDWLAPTVTSHLSHEPFPTPFDWVGTRDPTAWLSLPAALDFFDKLDWDAVREHNRALCRAGAEAVLDALGEDPPAPAAMLGSIATLPLPGDFEATQAEANRVMARLREDHGVHPMPVPFGGRMWVRISAHLYNELSEYERLARVLAAGL